MSSSKEYKVFANECLDWAKTARSSKERKIFLQMARTWLQAACLAERREGEDQTLPGQSVREARQDLDRAG